MKARIWKLAAGIVCALLSVDLYADQVTLKSGELYEGFYQSEDEDGINFVKLDGERIKIPADDVQSMEFSQSGVPACFVASGQKTCDVILASIADDSLVIAEGKARRLVRSVPLSQVQSFELTRIADHQKIIPLLVRERKTQLRLVSGQRVAGKVLDAGEGKVTLRIGTEDRVIQEAEIAAASVTLVEVPFRPFKLANLYPGFAQYRAGRTLPGGVMMGGFAGLWTGFLVEYIQAENQSKKAKSDLTVSLFNNTSYLESFTRHQNNQRILAASAMLLYAFHWVDLYRHREEMEGVTLAPYASSSIAMRGMGMHTENQSIGLAFLIRY